MTWLITSDQVNPPGDKEGLARALELGYEPPVEIEEDLEP